MFPKIGCFSKKYPGYQSLKKINKRRKEKLFFHHFLGSGTQGKQEDANQENASIILLFGDVNYKVKSTSKLLRVSRGFTQLTWQPEKCTFEGCIAKTGRREGKQNKI